MLPLVTEPWLMSPNGTVSLTVYVPDARLVKLYEPSLAVVVVSVTLCPESVVPFRVKVMPAMPTGLPLELSKTNPAMLDGGGVVTGGGAVTTGTATETVA